MTAMMPRLFFVHFPNTSVVAVEPRTGGRLGFLCGFLSQADEGTAYIHFVGVDPGSRRRGLGRELYEWFFDRVRREGRSMVTCVTSPLNQGSIAFHEAMGFESENVDDYDGPGEDRVVFRRRLP
jgi:ribosomal protein S18 acetylase RimI-like enzyme